MCHTYFFKNHNIKILFADTDIPLNDHQNIERQGEEKNRVGNFQYKSNNETNYANQWIYRIESHVPYPKEEGFFGWNELLCIEFDTQSATLVHSNNKYNDFQNRDRRHALRRFPRPDLVLKSNSEDSCKLCIIDFKNVSINFYEKNRYLWFENTDEKYRIDVIKQLTYELALQQVEEVNISESSFVIPHYENQIDKNFVRTDINIKGIRIVTGNFSAILDTYVN